MLLHTVVVVVVVEVVVVIVVVVVAVVVVAACFLLSFLKQKNGHIGGVYVFFEESRSKKIP